MATRTGTIRKITLEIPADLLEQAQSATGAGITETVRRGLTIVAAHGVYRQLLQLRGSLPQGLDWKRIKEDRE